MPQRTSVYSKLVKDFPIDSPVIVAQGTPLLDVVGKITDKKASGAIVIDANGMPVGILTEQDITRRVTYRIPQEEIIENVMSAPLIVVRDDEYLYYAIARMRRRGLRHMPVINAEGKAVGMLSLAKAIAEASSRLMEEIDNLTREDSVDGLKEIKAAQVDLAEHLYQENLETPEIQGLLTHINNDIYRRIVNLNLDAMKAEGLGEPPVEFCVIVMGSGGRGENFIYPDQDNGFVLADYPDDKHTEIDSWFIELAERMTRDLDLVGLPKCKGFVMATNPLWRKTLPQWKHQIEIWNRKRNTTTLRLSDIFFDFRVVWGGSEMADDLRHHVTTLVGNNPTFLREMYEDDQDYGTALGWFGGFITEKDEADYLGQINLKQTGTLPLVEAMRLLSLREGIEKIATLSRMQALHGKGVINDDEHDYLRGAFLHICRLLLRQQIKDFQAGNKVSNYVDPEALTEREKDILTDSFKAIDSLRKRMRSEFTGDIF